MAIVYQNFDALTVGATSVPGFIVGGSGSVVTPGVHLGINGNAGNAWQMREGSILFDGFSAPIPAVNAWFSWKHTASIACGRMVAFGQWDAVDQNAFVIFGWLQQESDYSFSIYASGTRGSFGTGLIDNTGLHAPGDGGVLQQRADQRFGIFFEVDVSLGASVIGGINFVTIGFSVYADGELILSGSLATDQVVGATLGTHGGTIASDCNWVRWEAGGALNSAEIDEVTIDIPPMTSPTYPNPGSPKARVTQGVIEANILPSTANVRATQGVIEANILPSTASIRITQAVIELLLGSRPGAGPEYIKRRLPGSS